jgi:signal transduction histidine kinase
MEGPLLGAGKAFDFLPHGGQTGALVRSIDWSKHPLGDPATWPGTLKTTLGILFGSRHPMFLWWGDELFQFYNDAYLPSFGKGKHPTAMGQRGKECWPEIWPIIFPQINDVLTQGKPSWNENQLVPIFRNGQLEDVYWTYGYSPVFGDDGKIQGVLVVCTETTEQVLANQNLKKSEALYRESQEQLQSFFMQAPVPMVILEGPNHLVTLSNPLYDRFVGRSVTGKTIAEAFPAGEAASFIPLLDRVYQTGEPYIGKELPLQLPDEKGHFHDFWIDIGYHPFLDRDGKIKGVFALVHDVTDRVRAREAIQNQNIWLEEVLNRLPIGLIMVEPDTAKYRFTNNAARVMLGQAPNGAKLELIPEKLIVRDEEGKILSLDEIPSARAARGEELVNEVIILDKGDSRLFVSCNSNTIQAMTGHSETALVPFLDISDLKAQELELKDALRARDEFLSLASHELKTPITSLKLQAQMFTRGIQRGEPDIYSKARVDRLNDQMTKALRRIERLIDDMLDISRIRYGKLTLQPEKIDLAELAKDVLQRLEYLFLEAEIPLPEITVKKSPSGSWDRFRIEQVLTNLITNAIRYGKHKPVEVGIEETSEWARFWVKDQGLGIAPENQRKIFERFERITSANEASGLGLGLYIAHQIVKAHGGQIRIESEVGRGSTFIVDIPLK